ncbi:sphingomyelin phosphodiesterase 3 isoform X1 [Ornithorhynchus anatinus]|uniref:Sphingomyelin phosphodiesterase 3 n=1 Tax=Ornithorhynchus anatinus TaxID=9258 RepID=F7DHS6_ORNAN|nr:sphingomyelin phosphodiesterase 3 isoform X1 [Ornithorhynchus anatinus]XP_039766069.1 sphingomyelin phosphodiesterase 3 isoform X1 [Ornithorhynchus anatinus]
MVLYTAPFPNSFLSVLHSFSWALIFPCYWLADRLLASFVPTTYEKRQRADDPCYFHVLCVIITTPIYLALLVASLPFALIGFLLWSPLQSARRPYIYSRLEDKSQASGSALLSEWKAAGTGKSFCFGTANVCLLPDSLARFNNVFNTQVRAKEIGRRIRNGASRPQIKIYIDSPTNTSISAASFSSLVSPQGSDGPNRAVNMGIKRTTSMEYKGDNGGTTNSEENRDAKAAAEPNEGEDSACIIRIGGEDGAQLSDPEVDAPTGQVDCQADPPPEAETEGQKGQTHNHKQKEGDSGSLDSYTASRESLVKVRIGDGTVDQSAINNKLLYKASVIKKTSVRKKKHTDEIFDHEISAFFPANLDFLCLQEVFDKRAAEKLKEQLHHYFEYILYDVGVYSCHGCCSFKCLNSGLLFASRYPVLDAAYHCYPNGRGSDALASKGALFLKVQVGSTPQDQRIVGYISCTHLHALAGDSTIRCEQLDLLQDWLADFRKSTSSSSTANPEELVAFDVICGDLNFDNCSSDDKLEQQHSIFTHYKDPCRVGPGEEKPWAIGTLLDPEGLYDEEVCTPDNLQKVLESDEGRKDYIVYPTSKNHGPNQKGRKNLAKGSGRRIDYMLYTEEGLYLEWKAEVEEFSFITQLSGLTDHLPVAMRLMVSPGEEDP